VEQSKTTADMLKKIKVSIATLTLSIAHVLERFETIDNNIQVVSPGAEQINIAVIRVNEISGENKSNIDSLSGEVAKFKVE
jgi:methyl-accepting chemotaxis protein